MKTMSVGDFKSQFSDVLKLIEKGDSIAITYGKQKKIKAILTPHKEKAIKRKLGVLKNKGSFKFIGGHNTTEKEFYGE
jgi:antitoxin (DNA-binding transcriptional repressor) of toxin-antitoxin stability system